MYSDVHVLIDKDMYTCRQGQNLKAINNNVTVVTNSLHVHNTRKKLTYITILLSNRIFKQNYSITMVALLSMSLAYNIQVRWK